MKSKVLLSSLLAVAVVAAPLAQAAESAPEGRAGDIAKVAHIKGMDKTPVVVERVTPVYPRQMREMGIQGVATVEMLIDSTGRVVDAKTVRSTAPEFGDRAVEAARQWTFQPAEADGKKITSRIQVPFEFVMPQIAHYDER